jgi:hypothetical protein
MFPIAIKLNTHTEVGQIQKYLQDKESGQGDNYELSPALALKLERIEFVKKNLPDLVDDLAVAKKLMEVFEISKAQAYFDISDAKTLYGDQQIWVDAVFKDLKETRNYCRTKNDTKGLNSNDKNKIDAVAKFKGDKQTEIFKSWTPPQVIIIREAAPVTDIDPIELEKEIKLLLKPKGGKQELDFDEAEVLK